MLLGSVFVFIFLFNLLPAFAPPTWTLLSYLAINYHVELAALVVVGALAATLGRLALARLSHLFLRGKFLSAKTIKNVDTIKVYLEKHRTMTFLAFLFYAFSPFPSNNVFIAYGLTNLPLYQIAVPFFIGRVVSYTFWAATARHIANRYLFSSSESYSFSGVYYILTQALTFFFIYLFTQVHWEKFLRDRRLSWLK